MSGKMHLEAQNISLNRGGRDIVSGASLHIKSGELVGLIGPNGAGKSSLLRAIAGLTQHDGEVLIDGRKSAEMQPRERAGKLAYLPQDGAVDWGISAREVVMLGRHPFQRRFARANVSDQQAVEAALAEMEADDFSDRPANVLSGGEKARVLLARALAVGAPFLLADEPIAALDPYHQLLVMEVLKARTVPDEAGRGCGVLLVLHDLALAIRFCDSVIVMDHGRIIAEGAPSEVLVSGLIERIYGVLPLSGEHDGQKWLLPWARLR